MSNTMEQKRALTEDEQVARWVRQAQEGSREAFDGLVGHFQGAMYNLAYRMVNHPEDAGDLTQEVFVRMYRKLGTFRWQSKFSTWLYALAVNTCHSGRRRRRRIEAREVWSLDAADGDGSDGPGGPEPADPADPPSVQLERREVREFVEQTIAGLEEEFRAVIVMRDLQGMTYEEIGEVLDCSPGTVKSRISRARMKVKDKLVKEGLV